MKNYGSGMGRGGMMEARQRSYAERRIAQLGALVMLVLVLAAIVWRAMPESESAPERIKGQVDIVRGTLLAIGRAWAREGSGIKVKPMALFGSDCCDPDLCSKYALEACSSRKARESADTIPPPSENGDQGGGGDGGDDNIVIDRASIPTNSPPFIAGTRGRALSGVARRHPGAAEAAAALGLHLVEGGSSKSLRSYYGQQAQDRAEEQAQASNQDDYGAPPPTVGLIHKRVKHLGALRAAEAFGLHVSNLGPDADKAVGGIETEKLLQVQEPQRFQSLTDIFSAPLNVMSNIWSSALNVPASDRAAATGAREESDQGWQSTQQALGSVGGKGDINVRYKPQGDWGMHVHALPAPDHNIDVRMRPEGRGINVVASPNEEQGIRVFAKENTQGITVPAGIEGDEIVFPVPHPLSGRGIKDPRTRVLNVGTVTSQDGGYSGITNHMYKTKDYPVVPPPPAPVADWHAQPGWRQGNQDDIASITVHNPPPVHPEVHLTVEVYCPPYEAPEHGTVWYKGQEYAGSTSSSSDSKKRNVFTWDGREFPIAREGDIKEGEQVKVSCNVHYELSKDGEAMPRCLSTGEWEKGKTCKPIMCPPYVPPRHGKVFPDTGVQAGQTVTIYCDEGYEEYTGKVTHKMLQIAAAEGRKLSSADPWMDYNAWFGGANQGLDGQHKLSKLAGPKAAYGAVMAMSSMDHGGLLQRGRVAQRLAELKRRRDDALEKAQRDEVEVPLSKALGHMTEKQMDAVVKHYVDTPLPPREALRQSGRRLLEESPRDEDDDDVHQTAESGREDDVFTRMQNQLTEVKALQQNAASGVSDEAAARSSANARTGTDKAAQDQLSRRKMVLKKSPMCLDTRKYERGIMCKKIAVPSPPPPRPNAVAPPPPAVPPRTYTPPPRSEAEIPVICPSYIAPEHGSVLYEGKVYHIATRSGTRVNGYVKIQCEQHYRPTKIGSLYPKCLWSGEWEVGASCEPIYCDPLELPADSHAHVNTKSHVKAGSQVHIDCDDFYRISISNGGTQNPMCLESGVFEKPAICVPIPCPKVDGGVRPCRPAIDHIVEDPTPSQIKYWETEFPNPGVFDYVPNVFDHEPRPTQWF